MSIVLILNYIILIFITIYESFLFFVMTICELFLNVLSRRQFVAEKQMPNHGQNSSESNKKIGKGQINNK